MKNENAADNKAAARYGYARIGVSTPDGHWTFGFALFVYFWKTFSSLKRKKFKKILTAFPNQPRR